MTERELILHVLAKAGLGRFAPQVEALIQPAIAVDVVADEIAMAASRFGGDPDLPATMAWPRAWDVPMEFVAQVRLADAAPHDVDGVLPATGSLVFFYNSHWTNSYAEGDEGRFECGKVFLLDDAEPLVRTAAPQVEHEDAYGKRIAPQVYAPVGLRFRSTSTIPDLGVFLRGAALADLRGVWEDFLYQHQEVLPRARHQILGHLAQHDDLHVMTTDDVLLFQIDTEPLTGFDWGDRYFLYFIAAAADVARRDFSRVRLEQGISC